MEVIFGYGQSTMDKRLAGLSFLLTLGWVVAVIGVMFFLALNPSHLMTELIECPLPLKYYIHSFG
ncbi:hypothetical protein AYK59_18810 [Pseudomonas synxantha]|nr:hypothetical protein AYK59_18810 [Pseudomonas synxantha]